MAHVLVVGGAGYIGSAMAAMLLDDGHKVTILDNLSTGHRELVLSDSFVLGQCGSRLTLNEIFGNSKIDCVMHFAAKSIVPESVQFPDLYYENNVLQTTVLLNAMLDHGVTNLVFSSTCATYGDVQTPSISEEQVQKPVNPYGQTKLEAENLMRRLAASRGLRTVALRYFNACGAEAKLRVGEWHEPETHLIPRLLKAALKNETAQIYGNDYPTPDGTCVRDYVHVSELASAHALAMKWLLTGNPKDCGIFEAFNLGSENGTSVLELLTAVEVMIGRELKREILPRREGDPAILIANSKKIRKTLGWVPSNNHLHVILKSALEWEQKRSAFPAVGTSPSVHP